MRLAQIAGIGLDLVEVRRVRALLEKYGELFKRRVFTTDEINYCEAKKRAAEHYAGRLAAKEAVMKALGTGRAKGVQWQDIEVRTGRHGRPAIALRRKARSVAAKCRITAFHVSISHTTAHALAWVVAEKCHEDIRLVKKRREYS